MSNDNNISPQLWAVRLNFHRVLSGGLPEKLSDALEDLAFSIFLHNLEPVDGDNWALTLTLEDKPDVGEILRRVRLVADAESLPELLTEKDVVVERLPEKDWLKHVHESFPPLRIGRFFVHGSHYTGAPPGDSLALQIDAATAFGSGEHETTRLCLQALERLKGEREFRNGLDMGCGSGILSVALAKLWPSLQVTAIDIDPESIGVTRRHAEMNGVSDNIGTAAGDGYQTPLAVKKMPYDIITANILANPLIDMAPALAAALGQGGYAVLSGILRKQKDAVAGAHEKQGLRLVHAGEDGDWQMLLLRK